MANNTVTVSGMFGSGKTYFAGSTVVIDISGLEWPEDEGGNPTSPFNIVHVDVVYGGTVVGKFKQDTGGQPSISFDIHEALTALWAGYDFTGTDASPREVMKAQAALTADSGQACQRAMREYVLRISTEYLSSDGVFTVTQCEDGQGNTDIPGGRCLIGWLTEWERSLIVNKEDADVSHWEHTGVRNGDASTKPTSSPERVGVDSITSWTDLTDGYTRTIFYPAAYGGGQGDADDIIGQQRGWTGHAPIVVRDSVPYVDFLFVNRRGAVETCSAKIKEDMSVEVDTETYNRTEGPSFSPSRTLMTVLQEGPRRSWSMSSGHQTRDWAACWMLLAYQDRGMVVRRFVPVIVEPAKKSTSVYDKTKQQLSHVDFTVKLALEG